MIYMSRAFLFHYEDKKFITDADTQMDAEMKFWEEFGKDPEKVIELENVDKFLDSDEIVYF